MSTATLLQRAPFIDEAAPADIICVLVHEFRPRTRLRIGNNGTVAEVERQRGTGLYRRANGGEARRIYRRFTERTRVCQNDLVTACVDEEFIVGRYQHATSHNTHLIETLDGTAFEAVIFEPYRFGQRETVWAWIDGAWERAAFIERKGSAFRVEFCLKKVVVDKITHRNDPSVRH